MKKSLAVLTLACVYLFAMAQDTTSKFSIGPFVSANLAGRFLTIDEDTWEEDVAYNFDGEASKPGYSFGLLTGYAIHKKITLLSGFSLTNNGYLRKKTARTHTSSGITGTITHTKKMYNYYYIDLPVLVKYNYFRKGKISLYAIAGLEANFNFANQRAYRYWTNYGRQRDREKANVPLMHNCTVTSGIGIDVALNTRTSLSIQPTYRQMLKRMGSGAVKTRLWSVGLAVGIQTSL